MATKIFYRLKNSGRFNPCSDGEIFNDIETAIFAREDRRKRWLKNAKPWADGLYREYDSSYRLISLTREQLLTYIDRQSNVETLPVSIPDADGVDSETATLINDSIFDYLAEELGSGFYSTQWSDAIVTRGKQRLAVFGGMAYELLRFDTACEDGTEFEYRPVFCGGKMFRSDPDECSGGMLYLMRRTMKNHVIENGEWMTSLLQGGWLHTDELDMTNDQIEENIVDEIDRGENVITRKPAGWA